MKGYKAGRVFDAQWNLGKHRDVHPKHWSPHLNVPSISFDLALLPTVMNMKQNQKDKKELKEIFQIETRRLEAKQID